MGTASPAGPQSSVNPPRVASKSSTAVTSSRNGPAAGAATPSTTAPVANPKKPSEANKKGAGRLLHQHQPHESQSSPITTTSATQRPSRRITASRDRVSIQNSSNLAS